MASHGPRNPIRRSLKTRFAHRFVLALKKLRKDGASPVSVNDRYKRYRLIRFAAYASMASSVGPKRAWARALLSKKSKLLKQRKHGGEIASEQENSLRELVPGGEGMDFCRLLNETGHYIKCLRAQVKVMKDIIHLYSN